MRFSDLSGKVAESSSNLVRIVVHEHPDLDGSPVEIEALAAEVAGLEDTALDLVRFEVHHPGADGPEQYVMEADASDLLLSG
ncbi:hypothetical protein AB0442_42550 [Kitasatospora sp. NPDC085895]|uniref:hypothetical protein n=1 Tax=Kitasatospora sp. NPDC085895 TaxID=3155057 RepID=UPI00344B96D8